MRVTCKSSSDGLAHSSPSELSLVRLSTDLALDDDRTLPAGATGTVVFVHAADAACKVEFVTPFHVVATVTASNLTQAADGDARSLAG